MGAKWILDVCIHNLIHMKINILAFVLFSSLALAQVGIGTTIPAATLDIVATDPTAPSAQTGLLVPRVMAFPATNPGIAQHGSLVFLTQAVGADLPGFYYWDNTQTDWVWINDDWVEGDFAGNDDYIINANALNDESAFRIHDDGYIGFGTIVKPQERLELRFAGDNDIQLTSSFVSNPPNFIYYNQRGTFDAPQLMQDGDPIGYTVGKVYDGTGKSPDVVGVNFDADGDHNPTSLPTKIKFETTPVNSASDRVVMEIRESGEVQIHNLSAAENAINQGGSELYQVFVNAEGGLVLSPGKSAGPDAAYEGTTSNNTISDLGTGARVFQTVTMSDPLYTVNSDTDLAMPPGTYRVKATIHTRMVGAHSAQLTLGFKFAGVTVGGGALGSFNTIGTAMEEFVTYELDEIITVNNNGTLRIVGLNKTNSPNGYYQIQLNDMVNSTVQITRL